MMAFLRQIGKMASLLAESNRRYLMNTLFSNFYIAQKQCPTALPGWKERISTAICTHIPHRAQN
jgi:hypothetical protein